MSTKAGDNKGLIAKAWFAFLSVLERYYYHAILFVLNSLICWMATQGVEKQGVESDIVQILLIPGCVEVSLIMYEFAAKDTIGKSFEGMGEAESLLALFWEISSRDKNGHSNATESAKESIRRCKWELKNIKKGKLPISAFDTDGEGRLKSHEKYLYERQRDIIDGVKGGDSESAVIRSIHRADTDEGMRLWDSKTYKTDEEQQASFYRYIIQAFKDAAERKVKVRRVFICGDLKTLNAGTRKRLKRIQQYQKECKAECRFIERTLAESLTEYNKDVLISPTHAICFEDIGWAANAYEVVDQVELGMRSEAFDKLWDNACETYEGLRQ